MSMILIREIDSLKESILRLSFDVEERLRKALRAVAERDAALAREVMAGDNEIDTREVQIEEECLKILALHHPVASDLRFVIAVLKIDNDLERLADIAVNIADRAQRLSDVPPSGLESHLQRMGDAATGMLRRVFDALMRHDSTMAAEVLALDDAVDDMNRTTIREVIQRVRTGDVAIDALLLLLGVSRELERVGDHATNIAEDLIYMFDGAIIRHTHRRGRDDASAVSGGRPHPQAVTAARTPVS